MFGTKQPKCLVILLIVAVLAMSFCFQGDVLAQYTQAECDAARQACSDAAATAAFVCAAAFLEPTFLGELACAYFGTAWVLKCAYADEVCARVNGG